MDALRRADLELTPGVREPLHVVGPHPGRVDDDAGAHGASLTRLGVAQVGADDAAALTEEADDLRGAAHDGAVRRRGAHKGQRVARVVALRVVVADSTDEGVAT